MAKTLELHEHVFVRGPRSRFAGTKLSHIVHSHEGGSEPHQHPETGPASYDRKPKFTAKPNREQFPVVALEEWQKSFDLVVTDSALLSGKTPIGNTPLSEVFMPAAETMVTKFRLRCNVIDARKGGNRG